MCKPTHKKKKIKKKKFYVTYKFICFAFWKFPKGLRINEYFKVVLNFDRSGLYFNDSILKKEKKKKKKPNFVFRKLQSSKLV